MVPKTDWWFIVISLWNTNHVWGYINIRNPFDVVPSLQSKSKSFGLLMLPCWTMIPITPIFTKHWQWYWFLLEGIVHLHNIVMVWSWSQDQRAEPIQNLGRCITFSVVRHSTDPATLLMILNVKWWVIPPYLESHPLPTSWLWVNSWPCPAMFDEPTVIWGAPSLQWATELLEAATENSMWKPQKMDFRPETPQKNHAFL